MKKKLIILALIMTFLCMGASSLTTRIDSYKTLDTLTNAASAVDSDLTAASGYGIISAGGPQTGEVDMKIEGGSRDTYANNIVLTLAAVTAADGDTLTEKLYGRVDSGPQQLIASIVWTIGTARTDGSTATLLWADTAVVTSTHIITITVADGGGSNRVCSVALDLGAYRYVKSLITAQTGDPTLITVYYRTY